jgi:uncharacterized damage-inducible protein DinB
MEDLQYPIGRFEWRDEPAGEGLQATQSERQRWIQEIEQAPARLRAAVKGLRPEQFDTPYRPGGWTVRQVVHHLADSHLNSYVRFRLALTEREPTVKPYDEKAWAELVDARTSDTEVSLTLLEALHHRWAMLLRSLGPEDFVRRFRHPEHGPMTLEKTLALYAWHGRHHVAHITSLRERMGWAPGERAGGV